MTLIDVLKLISSEYFPPVMETRHGKISCINSIPQSIFKVNICFMAEEETWITCNIQNEILIPWYDCEVSSAYPDMSFTMNIWLKDAEYLNNNYSNHIQYKEVVERSL